VGRILQKDSAVDRIRMLSSAGAASVADYGLDTSTGDHFTPFRLDRSLSGGDEIELSEDLTVCVYYTPGHTRDCLSYYIPQRKTLIASEALGIPDYTGYVFTDFLVDYDLYVDSMRTLRDLDIDVLCFGHGFVYTDRDAREHIPNALKHAEKFFSLVTTCLDEEGNDTERVIQRVKAFEYDGKAGSKQPEPAYLLNLQARITAVQRYLADQNRN
jgi:glyoxylase-like metal-dependent hydrolase (beta-lactamase superfamily II)